MPTEQEQIVFDLMTKASNDSWASLNRNAELLVSVAGKEHVFNLIRAGMHPYLRLLMDLGNSPSGIASLTAFMAMHLDYIDSHRKEGAEAIQALPVPSNDEIQSMRRAIEAAIEPVIRRLEEKYPNT